MSSPTNVIRHVCTADITLKERRLHLARLEQCASDCIYGSDNVLIRGYEDQLLLSGWGIYERLGVPFFLCVIGVRPELTERRGGNNSWLHIMIREISRLRRVRVRNFVRRC